jgi:hypothetical protein
MAEDEKKGTEGQQPPEGNDGESVKKGKGN